MTRAWKFGGKAGLAFTMAMAAHLGVLSDGKMGASVARADRIKVAVKALALVGRHENE